ncbi:MAG: AraC family transcriptional regulator [Saccharothrix sp.]|nr:AraC family transcriptional regulator [Saccharothrix sp.]
MQDSGFWYQDWAATVAHPATICAALVGTVVAALSGAGADPAEIERTLGFGPDRLADPDEQLPLRHLARLERESPRLTGDPAIALHLAARCRGEGGEVGIVGHLAAHSRTVGDGIQQVVRYANLLGTGVGLTLRRRGPTAELVYVRTDPGSATVQGVEMALAETVMTLRQLAGGVLDPVVARFRHPPPAYVAEYRVVFGGAVRFGQAEDSVAFPSAVLDLPPPRAQPYVGRVLTEHADALLERVDAAGPYRRRVRASILDQLPHGPAGVDRTARALGMSRQTLYRRLKEEGTSFQALLDDIRRRAAARYLAESVHPLGEVAFLLGFSDNSAFHRAVRRWFGVNPHTYRQQSR